jgi:hypothetical protein
VKAGARAGDSAREAAGTTSSLGMKTSRERDGENLSTEVKPLK